MSVNVASGRGRVLTRIAITVASITVTLMLAGAYARGAVRESNPAPGRLVDVNGHRIHILCQGRGEPPVVLDAGLLDFSVLWSRVQATASAFTRVCSYDRAGLGWSEAGPAPRSSATAVTDLEELLVAAEVTPPYILVGHSYGGMNVRRFAQRNPDRVAGLVLVDAAHVDQMRRVPGLAVAMESVQRQFRSLALMNTLGLLALAPRSIPGRGLPDESAQQFRSVLAASGYFRGAMAELRAAGESFSTRPEDANHLGDVPVVVVSRGLAEALPQLTLDENRHLELEWQRMQRDLLSLSRRSVQLFATASGHDIHVRQPDLVVHAIRLLLGPDVEVIPIGARSVRR